MVSMIGLPMRLLYASYVQVLMAKIDQASNVGSVGLIISILLSRKLSGLHLRNKNCFKSINNMVISGRKSLCKWMVAQIMILKIDFTPHSGAVYGGSISILVKKMLPVNSGKSNLQF